MEIKNKDLKEFTDLRLDFGCGKSKKAGYFGIDKRDIDGVDIVADTKDFQEFPDNCAKSIYSCHFIEHLSFSNALFVLYHWHRILTSDGSLQIFFPDIGRVDPKVDKERAIKHAFGGRDYPDNYHKSFWTEDSMKFFLLRAGFSNIERIYYNGRDHPFKKPMNWTTGFECKKGAKHGENC